jgi:hypothetical protein
MGQTKGSPLAGLGNFGATNDCVGDGGLLEDEDLDARPRNLEAARVGRRVDDWAELDEV